MSATTFGLHGQFAATARTHVLRITPQADASPDLAVTYLDAAGAVVGETSLRVALRAGNAPSTPEPGAPGPGGLLGVTGAPAQAAAWLLGLMLLAIGGATFGVRAMRKRRAGVHGGALETRATAAPGGAR